MVQESVDELVTRLDFQPDIIVGIARGGLIPARLLAGRLKVTTMYCLTLEKQSDGTKKVTTLIQTDLHGKQVLLVEEMLETGQTLLTAKRYLESLGATVATAALCILETTPMKPDYYLDILSDVPSFPWE